MTWSSSCSPYDNDVAPIVGQQITLTSTSGSDVQSRVDLLVARAGAPFVSQILGGSVTECDLVVKGRIGGVARAGALSRRRRLPGGRRHEHQRRLVAPRSRIRRDRSSTHTCQPPGAGTRAGIDRDEDGFDDASDNCPAQLTPTRPTAMATASATSVTTALWSHNTSQRDTDGDGYGNACDGDFDEAASSTSATSAT